GGFVVEAGLVVGLVVGRPVLPPIMPPPVTPPPSCCANATLPQMNIKRTADRVIKRGLDITNSPGAQSGMGSTTATGIIGLNPQITQIVFRIQGRSMSGRLTASNPIR